MHCTVTITTGTYYSFINWCNPELYKTRFRSDICDLKAEYLRQMKLTKNA